MSVARLGVAVCWWLNLLLLSLLSTWVTWRLVHALVPFLRRTLFDEPW